MATESVSSVSVAQTTSREVAPEPYMRDNEIPADDGTAIHRVRTSFSISEQEALTREMSRNIHHKYASPIPEMGDGKPLPPDVSKNREIYRVDFDGPNDPRLAVNWPFMRKFRTCAMYAFGTFFASWSSSVISAGLAQVGEEWGLGITPRALSLSLYVAGFATGPIFWGPMSEAYGRKLPISLGVFLCMVFNFSAGAASDVQTHMISRFFAGAGATACLAVVPPVFADMFLVSVRGRAINVFCICLIGGPLLAPVVGGYIAFSYLGWRWTEYISGIALGLGLFLIVFFAEETYSPVLLVDKAKELRERTGNWAIYAQQETMDLDLNEMVYASLLRPFQMIAVEPILLLISLYNGLVYGILYMCLQAMPMIYGPTGYNFKGGNMMLPYLSIFLGAVASNLSSIFYFEPIFVRTLKKSGKPVLPEARLPFMMAGAIFLPIGIFWLCWSGAYPDNVHWFLSIVGCFFLGFGLIGLFMPPVAYIVDTYLYLAASGTAAKTFIRSSMGAAFPLFTVQMFHNLGVQWAGTLVGCLAAILIPIPFLFYRYGAALRSKCRYAVNLDDEPEKQTGSVNSAGDSNSSDETKRTSL